MGTQPTILVWSVMSVLFVVETLIVDFRGPILVEDDLLIARNIKMVMPVTSKPNILFFMHVRVANEAKRTI